MINYILTDGHVRLIVIPTDGHVKFLLHRKIEIKKYIFILTDKHNILFYRLMDF
jgi:hypothetical protein